MASFLSILKKIGTIALDVEHVAAPIAETVFPQFAGPIQMVDTWIGRTQVAIQTVEAQNPADGQGASKATAVEQDFQAGLALTQEILAAQGKTLTYDSAAFQKAVAAQVLAYNSFAEVKASMKIVDLPKTG
jgi:hypothetical protein